VGVLVFTGAKVRAHFVENWHRVRAFGDENIDFLRSFARHAERLSENQIREMAVSWENSIRLSPPAGSLLPLEDLLTDVANRYLRDWSAQVRQYRSRHQAVALTRKTVREAVAERLGSGPARRLVKNDLNIPGPMGDHPFDVGGKNGRAFFAARALSFEGVATPALVRQIESTECAVEDVRRQHEDLPLGVVVLPPRNGTHEVYERAIINFEKLGAEVVQEAGLPLWAKEMADLLQESWHGDA
jgi:hypothetical protein